MSPEQLKAAREAANLRQVRLAELAGIDRSRLCNMEAGRRVIGRRMEAGLREALARAEREKISR